MFLQYLYSILSVPWPYTGIVEATILQCVSPTHIAGQHHDWPLGTNCQRCPLSPMQQINIPLHISRFYYDFISICLKGTIRLGTKLRFHLANHQSTLWHLRSCTLSFLCAPLSRFQSPITQLKRAIFYGKTQLSSMPSMLVINSL
jgi:hypothetical protein